MLHKNNIMAYLVELLMTGKKFDSIFNKYEIGNLKTTMFFYKCCIRVNYNSWAFTMKKKSDL